jgi:hypothetical protein
VLLGIDPLNSEVIRDGKILRVGYNADVPAAYFAYLPLTKSKTVILQWYNKERNVFDQILSTFKFSDVLTKALDTTTLQTIQITLEIYRSDYNQYPAKLEMLVPTYLAKTTLDPLTNKAYVYELSSDNLSYTLSTTLDNGKPYTVTSP